MCVQPGLPSVPRAGRAVSAATRPAGNPPTSDDPGRPLRETAARVTPRGGGPGRLGSTAAGGILGPSPSAPSGCVVGLQTPCEACTLTADTALHGTARHDTTRHGTTRHAAERGDHCGERRTHARQTWRRGVIWRGGSVGNGALGQEVPPAGAAIAA